MINHISFRKVIKTIIAVLLILLIAYICMWNMRKSEGLWITFDDVQVARTMAMVTELSSGQFPVRLLSDFGNGGGYMLFNYYSPLIYYISAGAVLTGVNPVHTVKLLFELSFVGIGLGMYLYLRTKRYDYVISVFGAFLMMTSAYFGYDAFIRGALPELWGFALIPWVFLAFELYVLKKTELYLVLLALLITVLIYIHAITAFIALPFLFLLVVIDFFAKKISLNGIVKFGISVLIAIILSGSYLLPVVFERQYIQYEESSFVNKDFKQSFNQFSETLALPRNDGVILQVSVGTILTILSIASIALIVYTIRKNNFNWKDAPTLLYVLLGLGTVLFLQVYWSWFIWQYFPLIKLTQFPYRYLTITTFLAVCLISFALRYLQSIKVKYSIIALAIIATYYCNLAYFTPKGFYFSQDYSPSDACGTTTWDNEYLPKWVDACLPVDDDKVATASAGVSITTINHYENQRKIEIQATGSGTLYIHKYYFPGWTVKKDGESVSVQTESGTGVMSIPIEEAQTIRVAFENTPIRVWANRLTLFGVALLLSWIVYALYLLASRNFSDNKHKD